MNLRRLDISRQTKVSEDGLSHLQKLRLVTTGDRYEFFIETSNREMEKLKFFLCD